MKYIKDFEDSIQEVFDEVEKIIAIYPHPYNNMGLDYLSQFHPFKTYSKKNYICYLLPFWLKDLFQIKEKYYKKLSVGNVFAMLYFFIQDDIIDSPNKKQDISLLPLANLFYMNFLEVYESMSQTNLIFLSCYKNYLYQWTNSIILEDNYTLLKELFDQNNLTPLIEKSAPLKVTVNIMATLSKNENVIPKVNKTIDKILLVLQLLDDWKDWKQDLLDRNYTYFLHHAMLYNNVEHFDLLQIDHIHKAIYVGNILPKVFNVINELSPLNLDQEIESSTIHLIHFFNDLIEKSCQIIDQIHQEQIKVIYDNLSTLFVEN